jgi:hypothetical protein
MERTLLAKFDKRLRNVDAFYFTLPTIRRVTVVGCADTQRYLKIRRPYGVLRYPNTSPGNVFHFLLLHEVGHTMRRYVHSGLSVSKSMTEEREADVRALAQLEPLLAAERSVVRSEHSDFDL